jgi:hypothetical protein
MVKWWSFVNFIMKLPVCKKEEICSVAEKILI